MTPHELHAKDTLTALELNRGESAVFVLLDGTRRTISLQDAGAEVVNTTLKQLKVEEHEGMTLYRFWCVFEVDGEKHRLEREVSSPKSFYEPWCIAGMHIWFDAVADIFTFLEEAHGECRPGKHARFAIQDAATRICPEPIHPWCPLPEDRLRIEDCYRGEDCWLGAYNGASAHGGLDINHPVGTPLWAPLDIHDHFYFNSLDMGHNNNRWRGIHRWDNGDEWILQAHHMTSLTVPEHEFIPKGRQFAHGAGVLSGGVDHSHFVFKIQQAGQLYLLDPWILFWQTYRDLVDVPRTADGSGIMGQERRT